MHLRDNETEDCPNIFSACDKISCQKKDKGVRCIFVQSYRLKPREPAVSEVWVILLSHP